MEFGLDKCAKATFKRGRLADSSNIELDVNTVIQDLEQEVPRDQQGRRNPALSAEREDPEIALPPDPDGTQV